MLDKKKYNYGNLFDNYLFLLNKETPQMSLEFVIMSLGGRVLLEQDLNDIEYENKEITHQICDRKMDENEMMMDQFKTTTNQNKTIMDELMIMKERKR